MSAGKKHTKKSDIIDVEYSIKPKQSALAVDSAFGNKPQPRFETPEQKWEDLEGIFQASAEGIIEVGNQVNAALAQPLIKDYLTDAAEVKIAVEGLTRDLHNFTEALVKIHDKHKGKTGVFVSQDDNALSLSIFQDYILFNEQFKSVTLPTVLTIMDHIGTACNRIMAEHKAAEAQQLEENPTTQPTE